MGIDEVSSVHHLTEHAAAMTSLPDASALLESPGTQVRISVLTKVLRIASGLQMTLHSTQLRECTLWTREVS